LAVWLAAGALITLAATPLAMARGAAGGYNDTYNNTYNDVGRSNGFGDAWSAVATPLRWLRQSSRSFQGLMRLLAERSARHTGEDGGEDAPFPFPPQREPVEPPQVNEDDDWPRRSPHGGEAKAGRDPASSVRVRAWRRRLPSCRHAGVVVSPGGWYAVEHGDTLWAVADAHYGYGGFYRRILRANRQSIRDPALIFPCQRLYIPRWRGSGGDPAERPVTPPTETVYGLARLDVSADSRRGEPGESGSNDAAARP
jgi:hypothetical protein